MDAFANKLARHVASEAPKYMRKEDVPEGEVAYEKEILMGQIGAEEKTKNLLDDKNAVRLAKVIEGKLQKGFYQKVCLVEQEWLYDDKKKVKQMLEENEVKVDKFVVVKNE